MDNHEQPSKSRCCMIGVFTHVGITVLLIAGIGWQLFFDKPFFKKIYDEFGLQLPYITKLSMRASYFLGENPWVFAAIVVTLFSPPIILTVAMHYRRQYRAGFLLLMLFYNLLLLALNGLLWYSLALPRIKFIHLFEQQ